MSSQQIEDSHIRRDRLGIAWRVAFDSRSWSHGILLTARHLRDLVLVDRGRGRGPGERGTAIRSRVGRDGEEQYRHRGFGSALREPLVRLELCVDISLA